MNINSIILTAVENSTLYTVNISIGSFLTVILSALGFGALLAAAYAFTHRKRKISVPVIVSTVIVASVSSLIVLIIVLSKNLVAALSVGGGLALIRYRTTFEDPKDVTYILASLAIGMACGLGFIMIAGISAVVFCIAFIVISLIFSKKNASAELKLKILVPESLDYYGIFEPTLKKYCTSAELVRVKTEDYGTLLRLDYIINIKDISKQKEMIDDIRCSNGNLTVTVVKMNYSEET